MLCVLIVFTSDHQTFCNLFKARWHVIECTNHDIVVGLFSELLMRLSKDIYLGYGKKLHFTWGSNRGPSDCEPSTLPLDHNTNSTSLFGMALLRSAGPIYSVIM